MPFQTTGVLGFGYLGHELIQTAKDQKKLWTTSRHKKVVQVDGVLKIFFEWEDHKSWDNLPIDTQRLIITIPPIKPKASEEQKRLEDWCSWIKQNRPRIKKAVYVSTSGVYPKAQGDWTEDDSFSPDHESAERRLLTENVFRDHFDATIVRPGGIYGPGRVIGQRWMGLRQSIETNRLVHRIHVMDLAALIWELLRREDAPQVVNAVDQYACPTSEVVRWVLGQDESEIGAGWMKAYENLNKKLGPNKEVVQRRISNQVLTRKLKFTYRYPDFKKGLMQALSSTPNPEQGI